MEMQTYLDAIKQLQTTLLLFIDDDEHIEENYQNLISIIDEQKIKINKHDFILFIRILSRIIKNHNVSHDLYNKISKIIVYLEDELTQHFTNNEILDMFKGSKWILHFLIEKSILIVDEYVYTIFTSSKYKKRKYNTYFLNEIKPFLTKFVIRNMTKRMPKNYDEKRELFKESDEIIQIIQKDELEEFIEYTKNKHIPILKKQKVSIFETNTVFNKHENNYFIDYAAFYGSIKIFKYLLSQNKNIDTITWIPAIHSNNIELIHILENNDIKPNESLAKLFLKESIKCHHNEIANYIQKKYLLNENLRYMNELALRYNNLLAFQGDFEKETTFFDLCKYDYYTFVKLFLQNKNMNFNALYTEDNAEVKIYHFMKLFLILQLNMEILISLNFYHYVIILISMLEVF